MEVCLIYGKSGRGEEEGKEKRKENCENGEGRLLDRRKRRREGEREALKQSLHYHSSLQTEEEEEDGGVYEIAMIQYEREEGGRLGQYKKREEGYLSISQQPAVPSLP